MLRAKIALTAKGGKHAKPENEPPYAQHALLDSINDDARPHPTFEAFLNTLTIADVEIVKVGRTSRL